MTVGVVEARANSFLNTLRGTNHTAVANVFVKLHTGDPGAAGTANASSETDRPQVTFAAPSGGSMSMTGTAPSWAAWDQGAQAITHISLWDANTAGNFLQSVALSSTVNVVNGNTLTLSALTLSASPVAA